MDILPITPLPNILGIADSSRPADLPAGIIARRGQTLAVKPENFPTQKAYEEDIAKKAVVTVSSPTSPGR